MHTEKGFLICLPERESALTAEHQLIKSNLPPQSKKKAAALSQKAIPSNPQSLHLLLKRLSSKAAGYLNTPSMIKLFSKEHEAVSGPFPSCRMLLKRHILKL